MSDTDSNDEHGRRRAGQGSDGSRHPRAVVRSSWSYMPPPGPDSVSSDVTPSQWTAMEEYIASPSPERWQILVQTIADEKRAARRRASGRRSRSGSRRSRRSRHSSASDSSDGSDGDNSLGFPSSVEIPTPPRGALRALSPLAVIEEDDASGMHTSRTSSECDELEQIAAACDEGVYEESGYEESVYEESVYEESVYEESVYEEGEDEIEMVADDESTIGAINLATTRFAAFDGKGDGVTIIERNETLVESGDDDSMKQMESLEGEETESAGEDEEMGCLTGHGALRFVPFDGRGDDVELIEEEDDNAMGHDAESEEGDESHMSVGGVTVEDIIADLNSLSSLMGSESSPGAASLERRLSNSTSPRGYNQSQTDVAVAGGRYLAALQTTTPLALDGSSTDDSMHDDVTIQNDDWPSLHPWLKSHYRYIVWSLLLICLALALTIGVSLGGSSNDSNNNGNASLRIVLLSSSQPSTSPAPSRPPSLRPSLPPSMSLPPSTHRSSLPWNQRGWPVVGDAPQDWLGWSTALSSDGTIMAVGAPGAFDSDDRPGYVRIYRWEGDPWGDKFAWVQIGSDIEGAADGDLFGQSVALSSDGRVLAVGAPGYFNRGNTPGYVRVYRMGRGVDGVSWMQLGQDIIGEVDGDMFGISVALSEYGKALAVGANGNGANGILSGHVRVYYIDGAGSSWKQLGQDVEGEDSNDNSGKSVDLSADGTILAVGAPYNKDNGEGSGHVRVYRLDKRGSRWKQLGRDIDGEAPGDWSGRSVSLAADGKTLAVGANGNDRNGDGAGQVRVYRMEEDDDGLTRWRRLGRDIHGEDAGDQLGVHVALSADGTTLAVGSNGHDGRGGISAGRVAVYLLEGEGDADGVIDSRWTRLGRDMEGEGAGDNSGFSVALSADGRVVAVGSPWRSGTSGDKSGHVRVFYVGY